MANEIRARFNLVSGTLSSSLTNVATSMSAAGLANLGVIDATNYAAVTIENEIVWVTAHTAGATTATVLRAQEGTAAAAHSSSVAWQHGPTALDEIGETHRGVASGWTAGTAYSDTGAQVVLPAGNWTIFGKFGVDVSTGVQRRYTARLFNSTASADLDNGFIYGGTSLGSWVPLMVTVTLAVSSTIKLQAKVDVVDGVQTEQALVRIVAMPALGTAFLA